MLTEHIPISLVVLDAERFRVVSLNRHAELEFSAHSAQVGGWDLDELLGHGVQQRVQACLTRAVDSHDAIEHEFERPAADGDRVISARYVAVRNRLGRPTVVICQLRDVTQQRRDAQQLRESEERYRELVESIDEGVFVTDPHRDSYFYIGARVYDMLGLVASQVLPHAELLPLRVLPEDTPLLEQQRLDEPHSVSTDVTVRIRHPQRGVRWLRQRTRTRVLQDGEIRVYGLIDDVSEERERELQLQAARDAAEAASRAKSQFMATMSHEIRTPMNGILGMTELLLGTALNDRQRRFAQAVYRSGESLLEIINDVLDFAKIEAGKLELAPSEFSLRSVVEDTLELLAPRAHEKGLELSFREATGLPATVLADPLRLRQVLTNLVSNAIKFTEHGEITVDLNHAPASAAGNVLLVFTVQDTGIGIATDMLPRLFNAFTQVHVGLSRRYGGTGLGLAISRQLVELMGGAITVRSQPGVGSAFSFTLPVSAGSGDSSQTQGLGDATTMPSIRVLVVDDHPTNRTVLENMLTAWGLRVTLVGDGAQALQLLRTLPLDESPFDLALIDWHMPGMDGIELAQCLRAEGLIGRTQLVLLSSVAAPDDVRVAQEAGFVRFIHKPVRKAELRQAILGIAAARQEGEVRMPQLGASVLVVEDNPVNQEVMNQMLQRAGGGVGTGGPGCPVRGPVRSRADGHPDAGHGRCGGAAVAAARPDAPFHLPHAGADPGRGRHGECPGGGRGAVPVARLRCLPVQALPARPAAGGARALCRQPAGPARTARHRSRRPHRARRADRVRRAGPLLRRSADSARAHPLSGAGRRSAAAGCGCPAAPARSRSRWTQPAGAPGDAGVRRVDQPADADARGRSARAGPGVGAARGPHAAVVGEQPGGAAVVRTVRGHGAGAAARHRHDRTVAAP